MAEVEIYTTRVCPYCQRAKRLLNAKGAAFREILLDDDPAQRETMLARSGGRKTVPQIFIDGRHIGGCDELYALDRQGELDAFLGKPA